MTTHRSAGPGGRRYSVGNFHHIACTFNEKWVGSPRNRRAKLVAVGLTEGVAAAKNAWQRGRRGVQLEANRAEVRLQHLAMGSEVI
jgi:hypothetical protein